MSLPFPKFCFQSNTVWNSSNFSENILIIVSISCICCLLCASMSVQCLLSIWSSTVQKAADYFFSDPDIFSAEKVGDAVSKAKELSVIGNATEFYYVIFRRFICSVDCGVRFLELLGVYDCHVAFVLLPRSDLFYASLLEGYYGQFLLGMSDRGWRRD